MSGFATFVVELLGGVGPVSVRRMFGGAGVYLEGVMFGLIAEDVLYLKADDALRADLVAAGSAPFIWTPRTGPRAGEAVDMGYLRMPEAALDDPDEACAWGRRALAVARAKTPARKRKPRA